jgi:hypothetical protein
MAVPARAAITPKALKCESVFGGADGVTIALGLIVSLIGQRHALWHAATGAGLAELVGMTAGKWLSDAECGLPLALANGGAACLACVIPAVPSLVAGGAAALAAEIVLVAGIAAVISWLRPERGILAVVQTYGVLVVAAVLCTAAGLL